MRDVIVRILAWAINSDLAVPGRHWPVQGLYLRRGLAATRLLAVSLQAVDKRLDALTDSLLWW